MPISVALCTYDGEPYLAEQLESLAAQRHPPGELIVCDDSSTDATVAILERFAERAPFPVEIHRNPDNLGVVRNFEQAIMRCTGDVIALCDQDDVWSQDKLSRIAAVMAEVVVGFAFSDAELIDADGASLNLRLWEAVGLTPALGRRLQREGPLPFLLKRRVVTGATLAFRTELRDLVCPIPQSWPHDTWIALITAFAAGWTVIDEPLVRYRIHGGQQVGVTRRPTTSPPRSEHRQIAERYERAVERVGGLVGSDVRRADALEQMEEIVRHHRLRADLPSSRLRRVPIVLGELRRGGYRRLARGTLSAVKDLVDQGR